jgi:hypothetical protein
MSSIIPRARFLTGQFSSANFHRHGGLDCEAAHLA